MLVWRSFFTPIHSPIPLEVIVTHINTPGPEYLQIGVVPSLSGRCWKTSSFAANHTEDHHFRRKWLLQSQPASKSSTSVFLDLTTVFPLNQYADTDLSSPAPKSYEDRNGPKVPRAVRALNLVRTELTPKHNLLSGPWIMWGHNRSQSTTCCPLNHVRTDLTSKHILRSGPWIMWEQSWPQGTQPTVRPLNHVKTQQAQSTYCDLAPDSCDRLVGLVVKASASRAEGPGFESRLRRDFFWVESYQWLKNCHSSGYPARRLAL